LKESPRPALRAIEKQTSARDFYYTRETAAQLNKLLYEGKAAG
jgi:hypothetical protein